MVVLDKTSPTVGFTGGLRAQGTAVLSSSGSLKRFVIDNPGSNFTYPPIVTFGGGLASQSATASIGAGGTVTGITLDGITLNTSDNSNIYEFGNGTSIVSNGSGSGTTGGFNIGSPHLKFGGSSRTRFVTLIQLILDLSIQFVFMLLEVMTQMVVKHLILKVLKILEFNIKLQIKGLLLIMETGLIWVLLLVLLIKDLDLEF